MLFGEFVLAPLFFDASVFWSALDNASRDAFLTLVEVGGGEMFPDVVDVGWDDIVKAKQKKKARRMQKWDFFLYLCLASIPLGTYVNYVRDIVSRHVRHVLLNACSTRKHVVYRTLCIRLANFSYSLSCVNLQYSTIIRTPLLMSRTGSRATTTILPYYSIRYYDMR